MSKGGDNREQRAHIRQAAKDGQSAGEAGVSTGADKQIGHGDPEVQPESAHGKSSRT